MTSPSSSTLWPYVSSTQATTTRFKSCGVCFDKRHLEVHCLLIPIEQKKQPMYHKMAVCYHRKPHHMVNFLQHILEQGVITASQIEIHLYHRLQSSWKLANNKTGVLWKTRLWGLACGCLLHQPLLIIDLARQTRAETLMPGKLTTGIIPSVLEEISAVECCVGPPSSLVCAEEYAFLNTSATVALLAKPTYKIQFQIWINVNKLQLYACLFDTEASHNMAVEPSLPKNGQQGFEVSHFQYYVAR